MSNLEATINMLGYDIASIINENEINKLLGVLSNDGVYAHWVYACNKLDMKKNMEFWFQLLFKEEVKKLFLKNVSSDLENLSKETLLLVLKDTKGHQDNQKKIKSFQTWHGEMSKKFFHKLSENLNELMFFREILEKVLIYARYHAKALDVN